MSVRFVATFASVALVALGSVLTGCAASADEDVSGTSSRLTGKGENSESSEGETNGKPTSGEPEAAADPACVESCNANLRAKCNEDETFCSDVCRGTPVSQVLCMANAATCDKSEWIRCAPEESEIEGKPGVEGNEGEPSGKPSGGESGGTK